MNLHRFQTIAEESSDYHIDDACPHDAELTRLMWEADLSEYFDSNLLIDEDLVEWSCARSLIPAL